MKPQKQRAKNGKPGSKKTLHLKKWNGVVWVSLSRKVSTVLLLPEEVGHPIRHLFGYSFRPRALLPLPHFPFPPTLEKPIRDLPVLFLVLRHSSQRKVGGKKEEVGAKTQKLFLQNRGRTVGRARVVLVSRIPPLPPSLCMVFTYFVFSKFSKANLPRIAHSDHKAR